MIALLVVFNAVFFAAGFGPGYHRAAKPAESRATARALAASNSAGPAPVLLTPVRARAFGPTGYASGDDASSARLAIDGNTATAWKTARYRTAHFGTQRAGTGLMIDMGRRVRVTEVEVLLGATRGADVELLTGKSPAMADLHLDAVAYDAGGLTQLYLARPLHARYLLIWFTKLPKDSSGTFQARIYDVTIEDGHKRDVRHS